MDHIIKKAKGTSEWTISVSIQFTNANLIFLQILIALELVAYLILFWHLKKYNQNKGKELGLSKEKLYQRKKQNILTFLGQFASFVTEIFVTIIIQIMLVYNGSNAGNGLIPAIAITSSAILTITFFVASPELKRFYFGHYTINRFVRNTLISKTVEIVLSGFPEI